MDGLQLTKVIAAVGMAAVVALVGDWFSGEVIKPVYPQKEGYAVEGVAPVDLAALQRSWPSGLSQPGGSERLRGYIGNIDKAVVLTAEGAGPAAGPAAPVDLGTLLASADSQRGASTAKVCASCHTFEQGGANRTGPNLWGVVGRAIAGHGGFAYSPALKTHGGSWTWQELDAYLTSPAKAIPGNRMAFNGIRNPKDRANLLAYLASVSPGAPPPPAPAPAAEPAPGPAPASAGAPTAANSKAAP